MVSAAPQGQVPGTSVTHPGKLLTRDHQAGVGALLLLLRGPRVHDARPVKQLGNEVVRVCEGGQIYGLSFQATRPHQRRP